MIKDLRPYGWTEDDIRRNIMDKYSPGGDGDVDATSFDKDSIMHYL